MEFIDKVIELMKENNINSIKLQNDTGIRESTFRNWKKGTLPTADKIIKLANYFNISADELLCIKNSSNKLSLNDNDKELLELFHQLPEREQVKLIGKVEDMIEKYKNQ